jgi:hypothetical protein
VPNLILKGHEDNTTLAAANQFINFFSTILVKFVFIPLAYCLNFLEHHFTANMKILANFNKSFDFIEITSGEVLLELKALASDSSKGAVGIETKLFKECAEELAAPLANLFNNCLKNNYMPTEWKLAHLTPNYKGKGSKSDISNYRPLSVLSPIAKIYESLLAKRITNYFESNDLFNNSQFGFRKGLSCELALNTYVEKLRDNIDNNKHSVSMILDLSKAFDTINHKLLLAKLKKYKFSDSALKTIENYLSDRTMRVNIDKTLSKIESLMVGVPQGSVLGPLLFIIFVNDFFAINIMSSLVMFADDTTTLHSGQNLEELIRIVENDMKVICEWLENNQLIINREKTYAMHFPPSSHISKKIIEPRPENLTIKVDNHYVDFVTETRVLGVILDSKLNFETHTDTVMKKVNSRTFILSRSIKMFPSKFRTSLFKLFIVPNFEYCSSLFYVLNSNSLKKKLEYCFAKSAKRIMNINIFNRTEAEQYNLLKILNILPLTYRLLYHYLCFIFIILKNPKLELSNLVEKHSTKRDLRSAFSLPIINKNIKIYSLLVTLLKTVNLFKKKDFIITNCKTNEFKTNMKKNIEAIYESSCFKMDTIFSLEFDKKKYYEDLKEKSQLEQTNNTND